RQWGRYNLSVSVASRTVTDDERSVTTLRFHSEGGRLPGAQWMRQLTVGEETPGDLNSAMIYEVADGSVFMPTNLMGKAFDAAKRIGGTFSKSELAQHFPGKREGKLLAIDRLTELGVFEPTEGRKLRLA